MSREDFPAKSIFSASNSAVFFSLFQNVKYRLPKQARKKRANKVKVISIYIIV